MDSAVDLTGFRGEHTLASVAGILLDDLKQLTTLLDTIALKSGGDPTSARVFTENAETHGVLKCEVALEAGVTTTFCIPLHVMQEHDWRAVGRALIEARHNGVAVVDWRKVEGAAPSGVLWTKKMQDLALRAKQMRTAKTVDELFGENPWLEEAGA